MAFSCCSRNLKCRMQLPNPSSLSLLSSRVLGHGMQRHLGSFSFGICNPGGITRKRRTFSDFTTANDNKSKTSASHRRSIGNRHNAGSAQYDVARLTPYGTTTFTSLKVVDILRGSSIHARDLFSLHLTTADKEKEKNSLSNSVPVRSPTQVILPRGNKVLVSFGHVRALIGVQEGMLFDAHRPNTKALAKDLSEVFHLKSVEAKEISPLVYDEQTTESTPLCNSETKTPKSVNLPKAAVQLKYLGDPFEIVFLEEILRSVCDSWLGRIRLYQPVLDSLTSSVEQNQDDAVHKLAPAKDVLQSFEIEVSQALTCLKHLLENDEDMLGLLLTEQKAAKEMKTKLDASLHENAELLLEEYVRQLDNLLHQIQFMLLRVQNKQELVALSMDGYRNHIIRMNMYLGIASIWLGVCTTTAGFWGMNVVVPFEASTTAFGNIILASGVGGFILVLGSLQYVSQSRARGRAVQRQREAMRISSLFDDMNKFDFVFSAILQGQEFSKEEFRKIIDTKRRDDGFEPISNHDLDYFFEMLDTSHDGILHRKDFREIDYRDLQSMEKREKEGE